MTDLDENTDKAMEAISRMEKALKSHKAGVLSADETRVLIEAATLDFKAGESALMKGLAEMLGLPVEALSQKTGWLHEEIKDAEKR